MLLDTGQPESVVFRRPRSKLWVELQQISWRNARHHIEIIEPLVRRDQSHIQSAGCLEGEGCDRPNITLPKGQEKLRSLGNCWHIAIKIAGKWLFVLVWTTVSSGLPYPHLPIFDHKCLALPIWLPDFSGENESVLDLYALLEFPKTCSTDRSYHGWMWGATSKNMQKRRWNTRLPGQRLLPMNLQSVPTRCSSRKSWFALQCHSWIPCDKSVEWSGDQNWGSKNWESFGFI